MPRSHGKHLLIANSYTLLLISLRVAGLGGSTIRPPRGQCDVGEDGGEARRWRAYLTVVEEGEPAEVVVYCPDCARREFGDDDDLNGRIATIPPGGLQQ